MQIEMLNVFEARIIKENISASEIIELMDSQSYFELMKLPYPSNREGVLEKFCSEKFILANQDGSFDITNLGALLFAKNLENFEQLKRKSVRVIVYEGKNKLNTIREVIGNKGYAVGFESLIQWINSMD